MHTLKIKPLTDCRFIAPVKATAGSAAFDIYAQEDIALSNKGFITVKLGFATEIPQGYAAVMLPRSGLGSKHGLRMANTSGLIDSDFRNEWLATLTVESPNLLIEKGTRFLQFYLVEVPEFNIEIASELSETDRLGGYGSTGNGEIK